MTTRSEKERQKAQQEKFQAILSNLLKDEDNKYCVDCDAKGLTISFPFFEGFSFCLLSHCKMFGVFWHFPKTFPLNTT